MQAMQQQGESALVTVRNKLLRGRPPDFAEFFETKWQMLTRVSWAVADRVVCDSRSYREIAHHIAARFVRFLGDRSADVPHADRWLERHESLFVGFSSDIAEEVDRALDFPLGVVVDLGVDRRGRMTQNHQALRAPVPEHLLRPPKKRKPRALVPDERVTERALDAIAATIRPQDIRDVMEP